MQGPAQRSRGRLLVFKFGFVGGGGAGRGERVLGRGTGRAGRLALQLGVALVRGRGGVAPADTQRPGEVFLSVLRPAATARTEVGVAFRRALLALVLLLLALLRLRLTLRLAQQGVAALA